MLGGLALALAIVVVVARLNPGRHAALYLIYPKKDREGLIPDLASFWADSTRGSSSFFATSILTHDDLAAVSSRRVAGAGRMGFESVRRDGARARERAYSLPRLLLLLSPRSASTLTHGQGTVSASRKRPEARARASRARVARRSSRGIVRLASMLSARRWLMSVVGVEQPDAAREPCRQR